MEWWERPIIGVVKAQAKYTCGHKARVKVYVAEGQEPSSGIPTANHACCPTCDAKWTEEWYERLRKYPDSKSNQAFDDAVCCYCGGPVDTMRFNALIPGDPTEYYDITDAYCEFCQPYDFYSKTQMEALRFGVTPYECELLDVIFHNADNGSKNLCVTMGELVLLFNKTVNPCNNPSVRVFQLQDVQRMLQSLEQKGKISLSDDGDVIHFVGWGEEWVDYNARLKEHREMLPAWTEERAKRQPPVYSYAQLEPAGEVDPMQEDPREWEFEWSRQKPRNINLAVYHRKWAVPRGTIVGQKQSNGGKE